jgi:RNA polymerase sigma-70 factor, ECF subfamily
VRYLRGVLGDEHAAEDVVQDVLVQAVEKAGQFDAAQRLHPWMYTIAHHKAVDYMRRRNRHDAVSLDSRPLETDAVIDAPHCLRDTLVDEEVPEPSELVARRELDAIIGGMIDELPDALQQIVRLTQLQGMKYQEAADAIGIPIGTVKSRLHTAMERLREMATTRALGA